MIAAGVVEHEKVRPSERPGHGAGEPEGDESGKDLRALAGIVWTMRLSRCG
jgi:hypothetical protein